MGARLCLRADAESKGLVERANGYLETSFLPGRRFEGASDFNHQLSSWLVKANWRVHAGTKVRPREAMYEERGAMLGFPPVLPDVTWRFSTRLAATITSGLFPTTTRSTRALSDAVSRCAWTWTR
jgi:hypothetical protein